MGRPRLTASEYADKILEDLKQKNNGKLPRSITIEVGELFPISAKDMKLELSSRIMNRLAVNEKKSKVKCACGYIGAAKITRRTDTDVEFECPMCADIPEILDGNHLKVIDFTND